tara:strand:+ start:3950 stop:5287 length:1338 start_codon:yes stop_codon:yes gene_type:complete
LFKNAVSLSSGVVYTLNLCEYNPYSKNLEDIAMKKFYLFCLTIVSLGFAADVSSETLSEMEQRIGQMGVVELQDRRAYLLQEQEGTQNPSRLKEIAAELSAIQKALVALVGAAAIANLTDDGYNDNVPPVITINGSNPATHELGDVYTDAGATAFDEFHGDTPVTSSGTVDVNTVGSYTITYTATDLDGNTATATRTVNVVDTTAPVVTVTGDNPATAELGGTYTDAGATATDASGTVTVVSSGTVDTDTLGTYTITYTSTDASGNAGTATRTVNVVDTTAPVFTSSSTFVVDEGVTSVGTVTATDIQTVTFTISGTTDLEITTGGVLTFIEPADYEAQTENPVDLEYDGSTYDITATVTATDASSNTADQEITVSIRDVGGLDDNNDTGTGTNTSTDTGTGTSTSTGTGTGTATDTGTGTSTGTGTGTGTGTSTSTGTSTGTST